MAHKAKVTAKGLILIPVRLRRKFGLRKGTEVSITERDHRIVLTPLTREYIASLRGILKGGPSPTEYLLKERKKDRML
jgi:AbrB family looped-hinge helix DNA binding protein